MASKHKKRHKIKESEERELIKRISEPRTSEDLVLALQTPSSKAYKDMINMLNERMLINDIINELIWRYLNDKYIASMEEKAEILRSYMHKDDWVPDTIKQQISKHALFEEINRKDSKALLTLYKNCIENLNKLQSQHDVLELQIHDINHQQELNLQAWDTEIDNSITELREFLHNETTNNHHAVINVMNEDGAFHPADTVVANNIIENIMRAAPTPQQFLKGLRPAPAVEEIEEVEEQSGMDMKRRIPPPPPPLPARPLFVGNVQAISTIILFLAETARANQSNNVGEMNWGQALIAARKANPEMIKFLDKPRVNLEKTYTTEYDLEEKKYHHSLEDIACQKAMVQEERQMNLCAKQYEKINHRPIHGELNPAPAAAPAAKNSFGK